MLGISFLPHASAISRPGRDAPGESHFVRPRFNHRRAQRAAALQNLQRIARKSRTREKLSDQRARPRRQLRRFQQHRISGQQRRNNQRNGNGERKIPGRDHRDHSVRLIFQPSGFRFQR